jgi:transglutaminase/protease-like cytokinesis protein 3
MTIGARLAAAFLGCLVIASAGLCKTAAVDDTSQARIEQRVAETPPAAAASVESLAEYLTRSASDEMQKVRAIYTWITQNISYDVAALASGDPGDQSAATTLARRKGVCSGYSRLFEALARAAGIEAVEVIGYSRGSGYAPGKTLGPQPDHAWTAVKINGNWLLMDCTWAAGYLDASKGFVRRIDDYYFLTPPNRFVYDHLPEDPKWQLLPEPVAREDFEQMVYLRPGFFRCGLEVVSHPKIEIVSDGNLTITFGGPDDALLKARAGQPQASEDAGQTFVQREGDQIKLNASFARPGDYTLRVYAKKRDEPGNYEWAADYLVRVPQVASQPTSYPQVMATFNEVSAKLLSPLAGKLKSGGEETFRLTAPGATAVAVITDGAWTNLEKHGDVWEGKVAVKGEQVQVAARFPGSQSFYVLLVYGVA